MSRNSVIQHSLPCPPLQQEEVDQLIHGMLNACGGERPISELITLEKLFFVRMIGSF
ncbi:hypothetical protein LOAG_16618 [Loa loa]|uniref:Uncharacterized protein n=1 Tax=Loa loa TaxID=7209 RepID=A0A1S0ULI2_LOALO|nr:hypothetical protein LOAG_16618 [Loa loa]EJD76439.1 hypothetical protein LOAG_16618 [Loa loa]